MAPHTHIRGNRPVLGDSQREDHCQCWISPCDLSPLGRLCSMSFRCDEPELGLPHWAQSQGSPTRPPWAGRRKEATLVLGLVPWGVFNGLMLGNLYHGRLRALRLQLDSMDTLLGVVRNISQDISWGFCAIISKLEARCMTFVHLFGGGEGMGGVYLSSACAFSQSGSPGGMSD